MYAIIQTGGKQYKVVEGQNLNIEKIEGNEGDKVVFDQVLLAGDDQGDVKIGMPLVGSKVSGVVVAQDREDKITVVKYKRKTRFRRKLGHRQHFTQVKIEQIA